MTREAQTIAQIAVDARIGELLSQPPYAFVVSPADLAAIRGTAPPPIFDPVKPSR